MVHVLLIIVKVIQASEAMLKRVDGWCEILPYLLSSTLTDKDSN